MRKVFECPWSCIFNLTSSLSLLILSSKNQSKEGASDVNVRIGTPHYIISLRDRKPKSFENFQKLTYRRIWDREIVGEESPDEDESYLSEKQLADILNKYPEYALLYELATINPADGN